MTENKEEFLITLQAFEARKSPTAVGKHVMACQSSPEAPTYLYHPKLCVTHPRLTSEGIL